MGRCPTQDLGLLLQQPDPFLDLTQFGGPLISRISASRLGPGIDGADGRLRFSALLIPFTTPGAGSEHGTAGHLSNGVVIVQGALELARLVEQFRLDPLGA